MSLENKRDIKTSSSFLPIDHGADPNNQNNNGDTALILGSIDRKTDNIKLLLSFGADPNLKNNNNF